MAAVQGEVYSGFARTGGGGGFLRSTCQSPRLDPPAPNFIQTFEPQKPLALTLRRAPYSGQQRRG